MPNDDPPSADEDVAQFRLDHRNTDLATLVDQGFVIWDHDENIVKKGPRFDTNTLEEPLTETTRPSRSPSTSISQTVIREVADMKGCDPAGLLPPFYTVMDPDALDLIYTRSSPRIQFDYAGCCIEITPARKVRIQPTD